MQLVFKSYTKRKRQRDLSYAGSLPKCPCWVKLKSGVGQLYQVSRRGGRNPRTWAISLLDRKQGSRDLSQHSLWEYGHCKWWLNQLCCFQCQAAAAVASGLGIPPSTCQPISNILPTESRTVTFGNRTLCLGLFSVSSFRYELFLVCWLKYKIQRALQEVLFQMAAGKRMEAEGGREREISCHSDRRGPRKETLRKWWKWCLFCTVSGRRGKNESLEGQKRKKRRRTHVTWAIIFSLILRHL